MTTRWRVTWKTTHILGYRGPAEKVECKHFDDAGEARRFADELFRNPRVPWVRGEPVETPAT